MCWKLLLFSLVVAAFSSSSESLLSATLRLNYHGHGHGHGHGLFILATWTYHPCLLLCVWTIIAASWAQAVTVKVTEYLLKSSIQRRQRNNQSKPSFTVTVTVTVTHPSSREALRCLRHTFLTLTQTQAQNRLVRHWAHVAVVGCAFFCRIRC